MKSLLSSRIVFVAILALTIAEGVLGCTPDSSGTVSLLECLTQTPDDDYRYIPFTYSKPLFSCPATSIVRIYNGCDETTINDELAKVPKVTSSSSSSRPCIIVVTNTSTACMNGGLNRRKWMHKLDVLITIFPKLNPAPNVGIQKQLVEAWRGGADYKWIDNSKDYDDPIEYPDVMFSDYALNIIALAAESTFAKNIVSGSIQKVSITPNPLCALSGRYCNSAAVIAMTPAGLWVNTTTMIWRETMQNPSEFPSTVRDVVLGPDMADSMFDKLLAIKDLRSLARWSGPGHTTINAAFREEFSKWTSLEVFALPAILTTPTSTLKDSYKSWSNMYAFNLMWNTNLVGTLPSSWSTWTNLRWMGFYTSSVSGTIPPEFGTWTNIRYFDVAGMKMQGTLPPTLGSWTLLELIDISVNAELSGPIPASFAGFGSSMKYFYVGNSKLSGPLPPELKSWTNLAEVDMSNAQFTGPWSSEFSAWTSLVSLDIHNNKMMTGTLPASYSAWTSMIAFTAFGTAMSGPFPQTFSGWKSLARLMISDTQFSGSLPFTHYLETISASNSGVVLGLTVRAQTIACGGCISKMSELPQGNTLDFSSTQWTSLPKVTSNAKSVTLDNSKFDTADLNAWAQYLPSMNKLSLNNCGLTGTLPPSLLTKFVTLGLVGNYLSGTLPYLSNTSNLMSLNVAYNRLSGELPATWGSSMMYLAQLTISYNQLQGSFPTTWSKMSNLRVLRCASNNLTFLGSNVEFPPLLEILELSNNPNMVAIFPDSLSTHKKIMNVRMKGTMLRSLPEKLPPRLLVLDLADTVWENTPSWLRLPLPPQIEFFDITPRYTFMDVTLMPPQGILFESGITATKYLMRNPVASRARKDSPDGKVWAMSDLEIKDMPKYGVSPDDICLVIECWTTTNLNVEGQSPNVFDKFRFVGELSTQITVDNEPLDCNSICRGVKLEFAYFPRAPTVGTFNSPTIAFTIPDTPASRLCQCNAFEDFTDHVEEYYIATIDPRPIGCIWCGKLLSFQALPDGLLTLPVNNIQLIFGTEYTFTFTWLNSGLPNLVAPPFHLEKCLDDRQGAIINTSLCLQCPDFAVCDGTVTVVTNENAWRPSEYYTQFVQCDMGTQACLTASDKVGSSCIAGYQGFLCSECEEGYGRAYSLCQECPSHGVVIFIVVLVLLLTLISSALIGLNSCEVDPSVTIELKFPKLYNTTAAAARLTNIVFAWTFVVGVLSRAECTRSLFSWSQTVFAIHEKIATITPLSTSAYSCLTKDRRVYTNFLLYTAGAIPICILVALLSYFFNVVFKIFQRRVWPRGFATCAICCITLIVYPQLTISIAELTGCQQYSFVGEIVPPRMFDILKAEPGISCGDAEYLTYRKGAVAVAVIAIVGFPIFCVLLHYFNFEYALRYLCWSLKKEVWWWELTVMVRKVLVVICVTWVPHKYAQVSLYMLVCVASVVLCLKYKPYNASLYTTIEIVTLLSCVLLGALVMIAHETGLQSLSILIGIVVILTSLYIPIAFFVSISKKVNDAEPINVIKEEHNDDTLGGCAQDIVPQCPVGPLDPSHCRGENNDPKSTTENNNSDDGLIQVQHL